MTIKIDTDVPLPIGKRGGAKFPWKDMQPGHSFFAPGYKLANMPGEEKQFTISHAKLAVPGSKWAARTVEENGVRGVRVWRVA